MARPKKEIIYFEGLPKSQNQLNFLKMLYGGKKTNEHILADAVALLYEKEKPNIEKMVQEV
jgi:hypothetical protein